MQVGNQRGMNSAINVTPLVDVVLVLLIIFMVMAPQMKKGPEVELPDTSKPGESSDDLDPIQVTIDEYGRLWIDDQPVEAARFGESLLAAAGPDPHGARVVIQGDARLRIGDIRMAMLTIEQAGFHGVRLVADRTGTEKRGD
jgi:biopolymer transport protein ExbD/biopolymer transport protein TolR